MKGNGLLMLLGKGGPSDKGGSSEPEMGSSKGGGVEREYAREAFTALQDGDEEGFVTAFLGAVRACASKASGGGYESEDAEM